MEQDIGKTAFLTIDIDSRPDKHVLETALDTLHRLGITATFFIAGRLAVEEPWIVEAITGQGHEAGAMPYSQARLDKMPLDRAIAEARRGLDALRSLGLEPASFRAPGLRLPRKVLQSLAVEGVRVDSSLRASISGHWPRLEYGVVRVPVTFNDYILRMPWGMQKMIHAAPPRVVVFRVALGRGVGGSMGEAPGRAILYYLERGYRFSRIGDAATLYKTVVGVGAGRG